MKHSCESSMFEDVEKKVEQQIMPQAFQRAIQISLGMSSLNPWCQGAAVYPSLCNRRVVFERGTPQFAWDTGLLLNRFEGGAQCECIVLHFEQRLQALGKCYPRLSAFVWRA